MMTMMMTMMMIMVMIMMTMMMMILMMIEETRGTDGGPGGSRPERLLKKKLLRFSIFVLRCVVFSMFVLLLVLMRR